MSFSPDAVNAQFATIADRQDYSRVQDLKWPKDKGRIGALSLAEKQVWYAAQDPHELISIDANTKKPGAPQEFDEQDYAPKSDFRSWWFWHYMVPLRAKRLMYRLKFW